jgi:hypothetical protein
VICECFWGFNTHTYTHTKTRIDPENCIQWFSCDFFFSFFLISGFLGFGSIGWLSEIKEFWVCRILVMSFEF